MVLPFLPKTAAPLIIFGKNSLKGKTLSFDIPSAQVKSCLLLAGLFAEGVTEIRQPYISRDHTERMLSYFGANIDYGSGSVVKIEKSQLKGRDLYIPGDFSSATFFIVAALILKNSEILIRNVGINSTRAYLIEILKEMGGNIEITNRKSINNEPVADLKITSSVLKAVKIGREVISSIIDEIPILCVACAFASGNTQISGAGELRVKESDRIKAVSTEFNKIGIKITEKPDGLIIYGNKDYNLQAAETETYGDHRIAMALSIAALRSKNRILIKNTECINNSFPGFEKQMSSMLKYV